LFQKKNRIADSGFWQQAKNLPYKYGVMAYSGQMRKIRYIYNTKLHKELKFQKKKKNASPRG